MGVKMGLKTANRRQILFELDNGISHPKLVWLYVSEGGRDFLNDV